MRRSSALLALCCAAPTLAVLGAVPASAGSFGPGNVVVEQVGSGSATLSSAATAVFLDEFAATGGPQIQQVPLPTTPGTGVNAVTASGTATSEGQITNSSDGRFIEVAGYDAATGTTGVAGSTSANVPRAIAQVAADGSIASTTSTTAFSGNNIRSATSRDGKLILSVGGLNGVQGENLGSAASTGQSASENLRVVHVFGGLTFASSSSGTTLASVNVLNSGTLTGLPGLPVANAASVYGFSLLRTGTGPTYSTSGLDTLYVADSTAGVSKYLWSGTSWVSSGTVATAASGLAARLETVGATTTPVLYIASGSMLYRLTDSTPSGSLSGTPTPIETAATNTAFRGVAFAPPTAVSAAPPAAATALPEAPYAVLLPLIGLTGIGVVAMRRTGRKSS